MGNLGPTEILIILALMGLFALAVVGVIVLVLVATRRR
jgi:Sec-independent protein translocase protein TatA